MAEPFPKRCGFGRPILSGLSSMGTAKIFGPECELGNQTPAAEASLVLRRLRHD